VVDADIKDAMMLRAVQTKNAVIHYIYDGPRTGKRGRPKTKDGKIDFANPDKSRMNRLDIDEADG
jgi:hypothetical protein